MKIKFCKQKKSLYLHNLNEGKEKNQFCCLTIFYKLKTKIIVFLLKINKKHK